MFRAKKYHSLVAIAAFIVLCSLAPTASADTLLSEDFSSGLPGTWATSDGIGSGVLWDTSTFVHPSWTLISGEYANVEVSGFENADTSVATAAFDCSGYENVTLEFDTRFRAAYSGGTPANAYGYVQIAGGTWQELYHYSDNVDEQTLSIDLSSYADGASQVRLGWRFTHPVVGDSAYWAFDNVVVTGDVAVTTTTVTPTTSTTSTTEPGDDDSYDDDVTDDTDDDSDDDTGDDAGDDTGDDDDVTDDTAGDDATDDTTADDDTTIDSSSDSSDGSGGGGCGC
jgi:hypothetical protein